MSFRNEFSKLLPSRRMTDRPSLLTWPLTLVLCGFWFSWRASASVLLSIKKNRESVWMTDPRLEAWLCATFGQAHHTVRREAAVDELIGVTDILLGNGTQKLDVGFNE